MPEIIVIADFLTKPSPGAERSLRGLALNVEANPNPDSPQYWMNTLFGYTGDHRQLAHMFGEPYTYTSLSGTPETKGHLHSSQSGRSTELYTLNVEGGSNHREPSLELVRISLALGITSRILHSIRGGGGGRYEISINTPALDRFDTYDQLSTPKGPHIVRNFTIPPFIGGLALRKHVQWSKL